VRIILYSLNYAPEIVGIGKYSSDFVKWLTERNHEVLVLCAPPYYPQWRIESGYDGWFYKKERINNSTVLRCPLWVPKNPSGFKRVLHLLSFAISSLPILLVRTRDWKPDVIFLIEPPIFCLPGTILAAKLFNIKVWLHIQDLEIDAGFSLGLIPSSRFFKSVIFAFEGWLLRQVSMVSTISKEMLKRVHFKGVTKNRSVFFPNWIDTDAIHPSTQVSPFRAELGIRTNQTVCLYSGSLGTKQSLELLIDAARLLQNHSNIYFVISGEGPMRQALIKQANNLTNVQFLGLQPEERFNDLLSCADIHLLPQSIEAASLVLPSKLKAIFASGRPVITTAEKSTQLAQIVKNRGICVSPGDTHQISKAILYLSQDLALRKQLGDAARKYAMINWSRQKVLAKIEEILVELISENSARRLKIKILD
jgi:colanic acid biosynthesis glycosyl transferase WcaI